MKESLQTSPNGLCTTWSLTTSIVGNYRAQFSQILHDNTYAGNGIRYSYRAWDPLEMGMGTQM